MPLKRVKMRVKILLSFVLIILLCFFIFTNTKNSEVYMLNNTRDSFVKIVVENEIIVTTCSDQEIFSNNCDLSSITSEGFKIFGSGIIINQNEQNYILTADHICRQMIDGEVISPDGQTGILLSAPFAMTLSGMLHKVDIEKQDAINDICLLSFERSDEYIGIEIYNSSLIPGERVYNLAAPRGIFEPGNVLIFDGFYTGLTSAANNSMMFSIYAEQGSSGSAIINNNGELVSIIHSTLTIIDNVTLGVNLDEIREFLKDE
jgi:S1-C subfamily serine protease